ncbi:MAG: hypothetical protein AB7G65_19320 [Thermoleophilia bacterium]
MTDERDTALDAAMQAAGAVALVELDDAGYARCFDLDGRPVAVVVAVDDRAHRLDHAVRALAHVTRTEARARDGPTLTE